MSHLSKTTSSLQVFTPKWLLRHLKQSLRPSHSNGASPGTESTRSTVTTLGRFGNRRCYSNQATLELRKFKVGLPMNLLLLTKLLKRLKSCLPTTTKSGRALISTTGRKVQIVNKNRIQRNRRTTTMTLHRCQCQLNTKTSSNPQTPSNASTKPPSNPKQ